MLGSHKLLWLLTRTFRYWETKETLFLAYIYVGFAVTQGLGFATENKQVQHWSTSFLPPVQVNLKVNFYSFFCSSLLPVLIDDRFIHVVSQRWFFKRWSQQFSSIVGTIHPCWPFYRHSQEIDGLRGFRQPSQSSPQEKCEERLSVYCNGCRFVISVVNLRRVFSSILDSQENLVLASPPW